MTESNKQLKEGLASICSSVHKYYEKFDEDRNYWSTVTRTPAGDRERCKTMNQFIECRLNFECFFIPELKQYAQDMDGHLFDVLEVTGIDEKKRKFNECTVMLHETPDTYIGNDDFWVSHEAICKILGPERKISFTWGCSKSRIKVKLL